MESFNSRSRYEFLNIELFYSVQEAELLAEQHHIEYSTYRSHSVLSGVYRLRSSTSRKRLGYYQFSEELSYQVAFDKRA